MRSRHVTGRAARGAMLATEVAGCLAMWAPLPAAWMWIGARVYDTTGSLTTDMLTTFGGFALTTVSTMRALNALDARWVASRRAAGHAQAEGALTQVVVVSSTLALAAFWVWFHVLSKALIIPFMPMH